MQAEDTELKGFLEYLKTGKTNTEYTGRIETMIQAVKHNEQARQEYRIMTEDGATIRIGKACPV